MRSAGGSGPGSSAISPAVGFALGVAGLVTAVVAYYQLAQVLSTRSTTTTVVAASPSIAPSATPGPVRQRANSQPPVAPPATRREAASVAPAGSPAARPAPSGWASFDTALDLQVFETGRLLGNTNSGRVALSEGPHELILVNNEYEIRQAMSISVVRDRIARVTVILPTASLSVNALPWADVWIDGEPVGTTPLANLSVPVGTHEVVWKHPTLGERRQSVIAKAKTPVRIGVEFIK